MVLNRQQIVKFSFDNQSANCIDSHWTSSILDFVFKTKNLFQTEGELLGSVFPFILGNNLKERKKKRVLKRHRPFGPVIPFCHVKLSLERVSTFFVCFTPGFFFIILVILNSTDLQTCRFLSFNTISATRHFILSTSNQKMVSDIFSF